MIRKLTTIIVVSFVIVNAILLAGVSLLSYKIFFDFTSDEISQTKLALLNESSGKTSSFISKVSEVGGYIAANPAVIRIFSENLNHSYDAILEQRELTEIGNTITSLNSQISSIEFYTDRFESFPSSSDDIVYPLNKIKREKWMKVFEKMDNGWVPKHISPISSQEVISYVHRLTDQKGVTAGYLKVNVIAATFFEYMGVENLASDETEPLILLNTSGRIIAQTNSATYQNVIDHITVSVPSEPFNVLIDSYNHLSNTYQIIKHENELYLLLISEPNYEHWRMVHLIPVASLYEKTKSLGLVVLFLGICALVLSIPLAYWIGKKIMDPIGKIIQGMKDVEKGKYDVKVGPYYIEEYDILSKNFNHMTAQIEESLEKVKLENHHRKEAELRALQSQITPHFLYNTLDMIHWKALDREAEDISLMVNQLSKMLRIGLSGGQKFIQLRNELEHVKCYINIQHTRLNREINYDLKVPASIKDFYIPKIILQPFIENSIRHGYPDELNVPIEIKVMAGCREKQSGEVLEIEIIDQGMGLPEDWDLIHLKGIGIKNIQERIWLYCGKDYGLEVSNQRNGGVSVRITLPVIKNQAELDSWMERQQKWFDGI